MKKHEAISLLGGTNKTAAQAIGITQQAVTQWPEELTDAIKDRVEAAYFRLRGQNLPDISTSPGSAQQEPAGQGAA